MSYFLFYLIKLFIRLAVVLFIIALILIKPGRKRDTSYFHNKMYAHRGLHDEVVPENSLTAFKLARENGYGVELDVQMTKDGQLVVFHDGNLKRMCGVEGFLRDYTYNELCELRLKDTDERIPLFSEVLRTLDKTDLICEIKGDNGNRNYELCEKVYKALLQYPGRYCVESFSPYLVKWFADNHSEIIRGQLSCNFIKEKSMGFLPAFAMTHLLVNVISKPDFVAYRHQDIDAFGFKLCKALYKPFLVTWTAKGEAEQLVAWENFDAVIFEKNPPKDLF